MKQIFQVCKQKSQHGLSQSQPGFIQSFSLFFVLTLGDFLDEEIDDFLVDI